MRWFVARHGETVFNAAGRMQGETAHTPLTSAGFAQADAMGALLRARLGPRPELELWASPTGRALQTLAIIAEHLELDWHQARTDARLGEIGLGAWGGRYFREVIAEEGEIFDRGAGLFTRCPPGGEWYDAIAARLCRWLEDAPSGGRDRLVISHGMTSRVLRGLLTGAPDRAGCGAPIADSIRQGALAEISAGAETIIDGGGPFDPV